MSNAHIIAALALAGVAYCIGKAIECLIGMLPKSEWRPDIVHIENRPAPGQVIRREYYTNGTGREIVTSFAGIHANTYIREFLWSHDAQHGTYHVERWLRR